MSLINQALKEEQRRRNHSSAVANAPMLSMARRENNKSPILLIGFTAMGCALAVMTTYVLYTGSEFSGETTFAEGGGSQIAFAKIDETRSSDAAVSSEQSTQEAGSFLKQLSTQELAAVQKMLLEKAKSETGTDELSSAEIAAAMPPTPKESSISIQQRLQIQDIVDQFSIQGIRKSGQDTRVFMNGRIQKIGDIVDLANSVKLVGFTEDEVIFGDTAGNRYSKPL